MNVNSCILHVSIMDILCALSKTNNLCKNLSKTLKYVPKKSYNQLLNPINFCNINAKYIP